MTDNLPALGTRRDPIAIGEALARSGYFADAKDAAQAAVKVMAGEELGVGPVAAMTGIHIVKGRVTLSANMIAGLIKRSKRYDFRVAFTEDPPACTITFFQRAGDAGQEIGRSSYSKADATLAGLWGQAGPWKQHPKNMLYARAMSNGAKWFCPDVFAGPIYTPDELGLEVDGATGEAVSGPAAPAEPDAPIPLDTAALARELIATAGDQDALVEALRAEGIGSDDLVNPSVLLKARGIAAKIRETLDAQTELVPAETSGHRDPS